MTDDERSERREHKRQRERRLAVLAIVVTFLLVLVAIVVQSARGDDPPPPPTLRGLTIEQWAALADKRLATLSRRERELQGAHRQARQLRRAMRARVSLAGAGAGTRGLLCVHQYEGAWNANTGNGYYGGLQMDLAFQRAWGAPFLAEFGTADRWPSFVQLAVGLAAYTQRGFSPWPLTRRACGI